MKQRSLGILYTKKVEIIIKIILSLVICNFFIYGIIKIFLGTYETTLPNLDFIKVTLVIMFFCNILMIPAFSIIHLYNFKYFDSEDFVNDFLSTNHFTKVIPINRVAYSCGLVIASSMKIYAILGKKANNIIIYGFIDDDLEKILPIHITKKEFNKTFHHVHLSKETSEEVFPLHLRNFINKYIIPIIKYYAIVDKEKNIVYVNVFCKRKKIVSLQFDKNNFIHFFDIEKVY